MANCNMSGPQYKNKGKKSPSELRNAGVEDQKKRRMEDQKQHSKRNAPWQEQKRCRYSQMRKMRTKATSRINV